MLKTIAPCISRIIATIKYKSYYTIKTTMIYLILHLSESNKTCQYTRKNKLTFILNIHIKHIYLPSQSVPNEDTSLEQR